MVVALLILVPCAIAALVALLRPLFLLLRKADIDDVQRTTARRQALFSGFIIACALAWLWGLSFAGHASNKVTIIAALLCMGMLTLATYRVKPLLPVSILATLAWLIALLAVVLLMLTGYRTTVALGDGLYCSETNVSSLGESSQILEIFRRHLFIDQRLYTFTYEDPHEALQPMPGQPDAPARCRALLHPDWRPAQPVR
ncbi:hypothetical protein [Massilia sp. 9096]|uniref:hypothetical protein n=1 Tax=Massilia sp. 9096 TaxID=1500894 RepID=UPI000561E919|nr:hypothetical protein [Massilia sp. 9096]